MEVTIAWIPRHKDIQGNEIVDQQAKEAAKSKGMSSDTPSTSHKPLKSSRIVTIHQFINQEWEAPWKASNEEALIGHKGFIEAPCGRCPIFRICGGPGEEVSAASCRYWDEWTSGLSISNLNILEHGHEIPWSTAIEFALYGVFIMSSKSGSSFPSSIFRVIWYSS